MLQRRSVYNIHKPDGSARIGDSLKQTKVGPCCIHPDAMHIKSRDLLRAAFDRESSRTPVKCLSEEREYRLCEWKLGIFGLILSVFVITAKVLYANRENVHNYMYKMELVTYKTIAEDGTVFFRHAWEESRKYSSLWLPLVCGFAATYFTWMFVYLDSNIPGVEPPSPLSPSKIKKRSGHTFHLNYVFSVLIGVFVTSYMYFRGVQFW